MAGYLNNSIKSRGNHQLVGLIDVHMIDTVFALIHTGHRHATVGMETGVSICNCRPGVLGVQYLLGIRYLVGAVFADAHRKFVTQLRQGGPICAAIITKSFATEATVVLQMARERETIN